METVKTEAAKLDYDNYQTLTRNELQCGIKAAQVVSVNSSINSRITALFYFAFTIQVSHNIAAGFKMPLFVGMKNCFGLWVNTETGIPPARPD